MRQLWLFDIDGTLIRAGGAGSRAMVCAMEDCFDVSSPSLEGVTFAGRTDYAITKDLFRCNGVVFSDHRVEKFYERYLDHLPAAMRACDGLVLPGVRELLEKLRATGALLGLLTGNMERAAAIKIEHFALQEFFSFGGFGDYCADRNDVAADAMTKARSVQGKVADPVSAWVVGDTPNDIRCARSQGLNVIAVATGNFSLTALAASKPDLWLESLESLDLEKLLD